MNVREFKEKLDQYPDEMPILFEWEGTLNEPDYFEVDNFVASEHDHLARMFPYAVDKDILLVGVDNH